MERDARESNFCDTTALFALGDSADAFHAEALAHWRHAVSSGVDLVTSSLVLVETAALLQRRMGIETLKRFHASVRPMLRVEDVPLDVVDWAIKQAIVRGRRPLGVVDLTSFHTMHRLALTRAFAFDKHFAEEGFEVVPKRR